jgi:hypothetical protein
MTNKEKKERIQKEDGKAFETYNVEIHTTYLNPKYTLPKQTANVMAGNGLLQVFELIPSGSEPLFIGRWDGGSRDPDKTERYDLDIDIDRVSDDEKRRFKYGQSGYSGHHTTKLESHRGHAYWVSLRTPDEVIFEGIVCFNLLRKIEFNATLRPGSDLQVSPPLGDNF